MSFNNFSRSSNKSINTSTRTVQLYNSNAGEDSSTIRFGFWNDYVSININPILPKSEQTDNKLFNYEQNASILLDIEAVVDVLHGIKLLEASRANKEEKKKITNFAVEGRANTYIKVGYGEYDGIDDYYLALFVFDNNKCSGSQFYVFSTETSKLMVNFDEDAFSFKKRKVNTQWEVFKQFFQYVYDNVMGGAAHGVCRNLDFRFTKFENNLDVTKTLIENMMEGKGSSSSGNGDGGYNRSGFTSTRRRRNNITLDEPDVNVDEDVDDEVPLGGDDEDDEPTPKKKKSSKKSTKKASSKKITIDDISSDMDDDIDDMGDID